MSLTEGLRSMTLAGGIFYSNLNGIFPAPWDCVIRVSASLGLSVIIAGKRTRTRIFRFAQETINKIENLRKGKTCGQCRFFINSNRNLCEKLSPNHGSFSTHIRLRLGYGICVLKAKMVRRGAMTCNDYRDKFFGLNESNE